MQSLITIRKVNYKLYESGTRKTVIDLVLHFVKLFLKIKSSVVGKVEIETD
ncbi:MAG: hypothetical protein IPO21_06155 [Bacteroidales bacterium]|nr:hypothetical protein [Bacteroidales bacterium]